MIIVIEGGDQAGKKTQSGLLARALRKRKLKTRVFSFPDYSTPVGRAIDGYLNGRSSPPLQTVHCLLAANRWEKLDEIKRAVSENSVIIMNRYYQSNMVYGMVNGMGPEWLANLDRGLPRADLVILLDVAQGESFRRKAAKRDQFEKSEAFSRKISLAYKRMARAKRWRIVDASGTRREVHERIMDVLARKLGK